MKNINLEEEFKLNIGKRNRRYEKIVFGTFFFGVLINFIVLNLTDNCSGQLGPCTPYQLFLAIALIAGFFVSIILTKLEK